MKEYFIPTATGLTILMCAVALTRIAEVPLWLMLSPIASVFTYAAYKGISNAYCTGR